MDYKILRISDFNKPIVLIGMMGSGKSFVGKMLADDLGISFYDMDSMIECENSMSITEMFDKFGVEHFRKLEKQKLGELLQKGACIISTGGGVVLDSDNCRDIKDKSISIWLKSDVDVLVSRLCGDEARPLLRTENLPVTIERLLDERKALYSGADFQINNNGDDIQEVIHNIISTLRDLC